MMIRAAHNIFIYNFFRLYSLIKINRTFKRVVAEGVFSDAGKAVVVLSNHVGWWDGFWVMYLNLKVFRRRFHFMMLEDQLRKYWFFRHSGGFSVRKGTRSILQTIGHAREILEKPDSLLLLFPQGRIESLYRSELGFEKGIEKILEGKEGSIHLVFNANLVDYFSDQKPSLFIYYREVSGKVFTAETLRESYNRFYEECRTKNIERARLA